MPERPELLADRRRVGARTAPHPIRLKYSEPVTHPRPLLDEPLRVLATPDDEPLSGAEGLDLVDADVVAHEIKGGRVNSPEAEASNKVAKRREADEDRDFIERARAGDHGAFRKLVEKHQRAAFVVAVGLVRDENDARELVQEAFLRVFRGMDSFQGSSSFFTWLYRIVSNLAIDLMRKPGRGGDAELSENHAADEETQALPLVSRIDGDDPIDVMRRREIASRIQTALAALPPYHRGVILMREVDGMSYEEMAQAMGVSKGTIMSRLYHARLKLQHALGDCYAEQGRVRRAPVAGGSARDQDDDDAHAEEAS